MASTAGENNTSKIFGHTLKSLAEHAARLPQVRKADVRPGDWVLVTTRNSVYSICVLGGGEYTVAGGWFDDRGVAPCSTTIAGCTWGGSAIKSDALAACGLCLEFGNRVVTSPIRKIRVIRAANHN